MSERVWNGTALSTLSSAAWQSMVQLLDWKMFYFCINIITLFSFFKWGYALFQEVKKKLETAANNTRSWKDKVAHHEGLIRLIEPGK